MENFALTLLVLFLIACWQISPKLFGLVLSVMYVAWYFWSAANGH